MVYMEAVQDMIGMHILYVVVALRIIPGYRVQVGGKKS
jgi:hypothetical protein